MVEQATHPRETGALEAPLTAAGASLAGALAAYDPRIRAEAADHDRTGTLPADLFRSFAKDGLLGATVPGELGGMGVDRLYDVAVGLLTLARSDASTALALHVQFSRGLTLTYEWRHGPPHVRALAEDLLRSMATGEAVVCGALKDAPGVVTELEPDGSGGWLLSGRKILVSLAPVGTHFFVHAQRRVPGERVGLVVAVVRRDAPGLTLLDDWDGLGMRASGTFSVDFDRCPITLGHVIDRGPAGARDDAVLAGQTVSSITMLGIYAGVAQAARDIAVAAVRRKPEPAAAARTLLTEIDARLYALRATAGAALINADTLSADADADPGARGRGMMTPFQYAKLMVNRLAAEVVGDCLTLAGGGAYLTDQPLARLYRDVRAGWFMQPYNYIDGVDYLSGQALGLDRDNDYMSVRANQARTQL